MKFDTWEKIAAYLDDLDRRLRESGVPDTADELHAIVHESAWTTSSEMLGEIKRSLVEARRKHKAEIPLAILKDMDTFIAFVDQAWNEANR